MTENFANNATTQLATNVLPDDDEIRVISDVGFPSPNFRIVLDNEILMVTGVSGMNNLTWTVTRALEGTTATSHVVGVSVCHVLTVGSLQVMFGSPLSLPSSDGAYKLVVVDGVASWVPTGWS